MAFFNIFNFSSNNDSVSKETRDGEEDNPAPQENNQIDEEEVVYKPPVAKVNLKVIHSSNYRKRRNIRMNQKVSLENGVISERGPTDVLFVFLYALYIFGMCYTASKSYTSGDAFRILHGVDSFGNTCNRKNNTARYEHPMAGMNTEGLSFLFTLNPEKKIKSNGVKLCVKKCLNQTVTTIKQLFEIIGYADEQDIICKSVNPDESGSVCAVVPRNTGDNVFYRCIPGKMGEAVDHCEDEDQDVFTLFAMDMQTVMKELLIMSVVSIVIAVLMLILLGYATKVVLWTMYLIPILVCFTGTAYCWIAYLSKLKAPTTPIETANPTRDKKTVWFVLSLAATLLLAVAIIVAIALRKKITGCIPLFQEAGAAIRMMPQLLLQPIYTLVFLGIVIGVFSGMFLYIQTVYTYKETPHNSLTFKVDAVLKYMKWIFFIGIIWTIKIFLLCEVFTVHCAVTEYYFTRDKFTMKRPVQTAMKRLILYHLGSLIYGSIAINPGAMVYKGIYGPISRRLRNKRTECAVCFKDCCCCCLDLYDRLIRYMHEDAFIMIAIYGTSFLESSKMAVNLTAQVGGKVKTTKIIAKIVILMGQIGISGLAVFIALLLLQDNLAICYLFIPLTLIGFFSFFISICFLSVYEAALNALFVCFCEDVCRNNGTKEQPYFMTKNMKDFLKSTMKPKNFN